MSYFQLYPSDITKTVAVADLGEIFGVYEIRSNESKFEMQYIETTHNKYIVVFSFERAQGKPPVAILNADDLEIEARYFLELSPQSLQPSVLASYSDNELVNNYHYFNSSLNRIDKPFNSSSINSRLYILQENVTAEVLFEVIPTYSTPPPYSVLTVTVTKMIEYNGASTAYPGTGMGTLTLASAYPSGVFVSRSFNDIQTGRSYITALQYDGVSGFHYYAYQISGVTPVVSTTVNFGTGYPGSIKDWDDLSLAFLYYTRKGWVVRGGNGRDSERFYLLDLNTGAPLDEPSLSIPWKQEVAFSNDGNYCYYIDPRNAKLVKAATPW